MSGIEHRGNSGAQPARSVTATILKATVIACRTRVAFTSPTSGRAALLTLPCEVVQTEPRPSGEHAPQEADDDEPGVGRRRCYDDRPIEREDGCVPQSHIREFRRLAAGTHHGRLPGGLPWVLGIMSVSVARTARETRATSCEQRQLCGQVATVSFWPLPPEGPLEVVVQWSAFDIPESHVVLDTAPLLARASEARPVWGSD